MAAPALTVRKHATFGGSSASRWLNCAGSTMLIASVPAKPSSGYADEGTVAHELAARCLKEDRHPRGFVGQTFDGLPPIAVTEEMCTAVVTYLEAVTHELAHHGKKKRSHAQIVAIAEKTARGK